LACDEALIGMNIGVYTARAALIDAVDARPQPLFALKRKN